ncbi:polymerase [Suffolk virus]|uniref:RNA-directed RNA polymerase n=2 Tax=Viruses TaxID=10239 RepID=A0A0A1G6U7_9VIRU|nr:polymerase [Suffolk virus]AII01805.1 polymerase [Deer tick mononegavirales-like virus]AIY53910.1 polymerase [Suffolk virus]
MESQHDVPLPVHDLVYERKFNVALRMSHATAFCNRVDKGTPSIDDQFLRAGLRGAHLPYEPDDWAYNRHVMGALFAHIEQLSVGHDTDPNAVRAIRVAGQVVNCQLLWNMMSKADGLTSSCEQYAVGWRHRWASCKLLRQLLAAKNHLDEWITALGRAGERKKMEESTEAWVERVGVKCWWRNKELDILAAWSQNSLVISHDDTIYFLPKTYALLIHNKVCDMLSVLVYTTACPPSLYGHDITKEAVAFMKLWATLARRYQQKFFNLSKLLEGLCIGETLYELEGEGNVMFLNTVVDTMRKTVGYNYNGSPLQMMLRRVPISVRHELSCLSKIMGHPFCDVKQGAIELNKKVNEERPIDPMMVQQCVRYAQEDFIRKYLAKEGKWPLVTFDPGASKSLVRACMTNTDPRSVPHTRRYGKIELVDYDKVRIQKCLDFDWVENFLPYVKDRTVSLLKSDALKKYIENDPDFKTDWRKTRLLLFYLLWPETETSHMPYMKAYTAGEWDQVANYLIIKICPKEKEHKLEARGFGCKSTLDRARGIIQELNVARFLNDYSDEHVMTLGEIALAKKLLAFRKLHNAYRGHKMIIVSVDASSWNNRFRAASVAPVMEAVLDAAYGVPIFSKTHEAYQRSFIYVPDADEVYSWDGQLGGIEGLNQDTWVLTYIHQIKVCMEDHPYPYYILCKGDDLRIAVMVPPSALTNTSLDELKAKLLESVSSRGEKLGHVIKVEDSYASECYFAYSKDAFVRDVEQPQTFRKIQKCYGANNAFTTVPDDYVASAYSNAHSASKTSPSPIPCYAVGVYWSCELLVRHDVYSSLSDVELTALLQVPNMLGGFPIIFLHNFFVRAESDLLPPFIDLWQKTRRLGPTVHKVLAKFLVQKVSDPEKCLAGLFTDCYSLPIDRPTPASTVLRRQVTLLVQRRTRNKYIKQLFLLSKKGFERDFLRTLATANVYNVKLLAALFECTPDGIIRELVRKFESGKSIYTAILNCAGRGLAQRTLNACYKADKELHLYRKQVIRRGLTGAVSLVEPNDVSRCPYQVAKDMRDRLWGKPVEGITQPPLQHLIQLGRPEDFEVDDHATFNHFELWFDAPDENEVTPMFNLGTKEPFVGAVTGRGLSKPEAQLQSHNILSGKIRILMDVYKWSEMTKEVPGTTEVIVSNLNVVARTLLEAYTGETIETIMPYTGQRLSTRTTQHHVRVNNFRTSIVPNTLLNVYTRASGNSRAHITLDTSTDHFRVNYLHVYTHCVSLWALPMWTGQAGVCPPRVWAVTSDCSHCLSPIVEDPVVLACTYVPPIHLPSGSELGSHALDEIREELSGFNPEEYYRPDNPDELVEVEEAQLAVVQGVTNAIWRNRAKHQTLYTPHNVSVSGLSALVGWSGREGSVVELTTKHIRGISMEVLVNDIAFMVYSEVTRRFNMTRIRDLSTALGNVPGEELPWLIILLELDRLGRFYELQVFMHKLFPDLRHTLRDNPRSYAPIFGVACCRLVERGEVDVRIAHLSYRINPDISKDIMYRIWGLRWAVLDREFKSLLTTGVTELPEPLSREVVSMLCVGLVLDDSELEYGFQGIQEDRITTPLFPFPEDTKETLISYVITEEDTWDDELAEPIITKILCLPEFLEISLKRYHLTFDTLESILMEACIDGLEYGRLCREFELTVKRPMVTIFRTDLVTCLEKVAANAPKGHIRMPETQDPGASSLVIIRNPKTLHHTLGGFRTDQASSYDGTAGPSSYDVATLEWPGTEFNRRWLLRPLGMGNISMSKAYNVLNVIGLPVLPIGSQAACLGDGYGGYTSIVTAITVEGRVVYNTFPNRPDRSDPLPAAAIAASQRTGTLLEFSDIRAGHYDLCLTTTYTRLEQHTMSLDLVTLDAEMKTLICPQRLAMLHYVATFFVRVGKPRAVLIMKVYLTEFLQWCGVLGWLGPLCSTLMVMQADASATDGELFLIAQLETNQRTRPYNVNVLYPPIREMRRLHMMATRYMSNLANDTFGCNMLPLTRPYPPQTIVLASYMPLYGWSKLQEVCHVFTKQDYSRASAFPSQGVWITSLYTELRAAEDQCVLEMAGQLPDKERHTYDTLRHTLVVLDRYMRIAGFTFVASQHLLEKQYLVLDDYNLAFDRALERLPPRLGLSAQTEGIHDGPLEVGNIRTYPIRAWKLGVRWGVGALAISLCI